MDDRAIVYLYVAQFALLIIFSFGCFWRLWLNHIDRRQVRWALMALGTSMGLWAIDVVYRTRARMLPAIQSRAVLNSWHFWMFQTLTMAALLWLFLVLQKPRKTDRTETRRS